MKSAQYTLFFGLLVLIPTIEGMEQQLPPYHIITHPNHPLKSKQYIINSEIIPVHPAILKKLQYKDETLTAFVQKLKNDGLSNQIIERVLTTGIKYQENTCLKALVATCAILVYTSCITYLLRAILTSWK